MGDTVLGRPELKAILRNAEKTLDDDIPARAQFLTQKQEAQKLAHQMFPYLKKPNPLAGYKGDDCVISFTNKLPKEFELDGYIDYNLQFEKTFIDPLSTILSVINWKYEEQNTLESLFI